MRADQAPPFGKLDAERILAAIESVGLYADGSLLALNSYENRVYRIGIDDSDGTADEPAIASSVLLASSAPARTVVAKFYRPGRWTDAAIIEEHAFAQELREAELSVVAPIEMHGRTLHHFQDFRFALFPMQGGRAPEPGDRDTLIHIGRALGRLHMVGALQPFEHRPTFAIDAFAVDAVDYLIDAHWLPPQLEENFIVLCEQLIDAIESGWSRAGAFKTLRLHGDCHPGNLLWRNGTVHFVDLDDAMQGPAMQDLWMLLSGDRHACAQQLAWLLQGYEVFRKFDPRELHLLQPLRAIRLLHYHAWIARRWHDPAFPAAFPWFDSPRHWEDVIVQLQEQLVAMREPILKLV